MPVFNAFIIYSLKLIFVSSLQLLGETGFGGAESDSGVLDKGCV